MKNKLQLAALLSILLSWGCRTPSPQNELEHAWKEHERKYGPIEERAKGKGKGAKPKEEIQDAGSTMPDAESQISDPKSQISDPAPDTQHQAPSTTNQTPSTASPVAATLRSSTNPPPTGVRDPKVAPTEQAEPKKPGFFARLFGRGRKAEEMQDAGSTMPDAESQISDPESQISDHAPDTRHQAPSTTNQTSSTASAVAATLRSSTNPPPTGVRDPKVAPTEQAEPKKPGFFARLFGRGRKAEEMQDAGSTMPDAESQISDPKSQISDAAPDTQHQAPSTTNQTPSTASPVAATLRSSTNPPPAGVRDHKVAPTEQAETKKPGLFSRIFGRRGETRPRRPASDIFHYPELEKQPEKTPEPSAKRKDQSRYAKAPQDKMAKPEEEMQDAESQISDPKSQISDTAPDAQHKAQSTTNQTPSTASPVAATLRSSTNPPPTGVRDHKVAPTEDEVRKPGFFARLFGRGKRTQNAESQISDPAPDTKHQAPSTTNQTSSTASAVAATLRSSTNPPPAGVRDHKVAPTEEAEPKKPGFFARLFGREKPMQDAGSTMQDAEPELSNPESQISDPVPTDPPPTNAPTTNQPSTKHQAPSTDSPASGTETAPASAEPTLRPGLLIKVTVVASGKAEVDEPSRRISTSGTVTLPLIGTVEVGGLTMREFAARLTTLYEEYLRTPMVDVDFVLDDKAGAVSPWGYVTVLGRVKQPGRINIPPTQDLTLSMAIQLAGGFDSSAKLTGIIVTRQNGTNAAEQIEANLKEVGADGKVESDVPLKDGDVVYIPERVF